VRSRRVIRKRRKDLGIKGGLLLLSFLMLTALLSWATHSERVRIAEVTIQGNSAIEAAELSALVRKTIDGSYFFLFPKDNILIYPRWMLKRLIMDTFKRVNSVTVRLTGATALTVTVSERTPYALWCGSFPPEGERGVFIPCYFIDAVGFVFAQAPGISPGVYFEFYGSLHTAIGAMSVDDISIGKSFLGASDVDRIRHLREMLDRLKLKTRSFFVDVSGKGELFLERAGMIIFDLDQDFPTIFYGLKAAVEKKIATEGTIAWDELDYIDLRFDNKVIFKFK